MKILILEAKKDPVENLPVPHRNVFSIINPDYRITVADISKITGYSSTKIREIVADLVTVYHLPVGSSVKPGNSGFFIITNEQDLQEAISHLKSRIKKLNIRAKALGEISIKQVSSYETKLNIPRQLSFKEIEKNSI